MPTTRIDRILELFFRALRGESLNIQTLAKSYNLSSKSISRDISTLKLFLADNHTLLGNSELTYCRKNKSYILLLDNFLSKQRTFCNHKNFNRLQTF